MKVFGCRQSIIDWGIVFILVAVLFSLITGCASLPKGATTPPKPTITQTPPSLNHVATSLDVIIVMAVVALGVSIALYFFAPETHALSITAAGASGAVEGSALALRVTLWLIPWIVYGLLILATGFLAYELYLRFTAEKRAIAPFIKPEGK